jgi:hypothetical protein
MIIGCKSRQIRPFADYINYLHIVHESNVACQLHENAHLDDLNSQLVDAQLLRKYLVDPQEAHSVN